MKKSKGSALTGVILMVLVMTLIGVPLLGMVVYNYRFIELNNSLKRSEYENEMAMDIISRIIRETVIEAINVAKSGATSGVNELAELQRTNFSSVSGKYEAEWINAYNSWVNGVYDDEANILNDFFELLEDESEKEGVLVLLDWWLADSNPLSNEKRDELKNSGKKSYVDKKVAEELKSIESSLLENELDLLKADMVLIESDKEIPKTGDEIDFEIGEIKDNIGTLIDTEGAVSPEKLNEAYNLIFKERYKAYIEANIDDKILVKDVYNGIVSSLDNIYVDRTIDIPTVENYLKIAEPSIRTSVMDDKIEVDAGTRFKKNKTTPATTLSATFVIGTPEFDGVASVKQETITLSNALLNQGGVIVGGKLALTNETTLNIKNDLTALGGQREFDAITGEEIHKTAIEIGNGATLSASGTGAYSRIAAAQDIVLKPGSKLITGTNPIYYRNLYVGESGQTDNLIDIDFRGDVVAEDDLEIDHEGVVKIIQSEGSNYYGFNDTNNRGPDSSSSIVINSKSLGNKVISLGNLYLAGRAFIEGTKRSGYIYNDDGSEISSVYKTGESIAIKENSVVYQTPFTVFDYINKLDKFEDEEIKFLFFDEEANTTEKQLKDTLEVYKNLIKQNSDSEISYKKASLVDGYNYTIENSEGSETQYGHFKFIDHFLVPPEDFDGSFDVNCKWKYFLHYGKLNGELKKTDISCENIMYTEGIAFDDNGETIVGSSNETAKDTSFRNNLADEYEKYTKYFGYMPMNDYGTVDMTKAKTNIFGANGWIKMPSTPYEKIEGNYYQIYHNGSKSITLSGTANNGIIVCKDDLTINLSENTSFKGVIIVGGNLTINGNRKTLTLEDGKEQVINNVINNYLGKNETLDTGTVDELYNTFTYDGSGSSYIVTEIGDGLININDLIGITNWKKSSYGRF